MRGTFWSGLYLALALAPLLVALAADPIAAERPFAVELGVALGFVAFALLALEFALVARVRSVTEPFGADALMLFHRQMGLVALAFLVGHVAPLVARPGGLALVDPRAGGAAARWGQAALFGAALLVGASVWRRRLRLRYEVWLLAHRLLAVLVAAAMLLHVLAVGAYSAAPAVRGVAIGYVALFLAALAHYRLVRPLLFWRRPWEVVANRDEGADTRTLVLRPVGHSGLSFAPGQFAWVVTGRTPFFSQQHPISISSSAEPAPDGALELTIKDLGDWSGRAVPRMAPGARVWLDGPFGAFSPDRLPAQGLVLIAGGVGITPMRSILRTMRDRGDARPVVLIYAAHDPSRAVWHDELVALEAELRLQVVHVWEAPPPGWEGERGFVTRELLERHLPPHFRHFQFLVCGPGPMMDALEPALLALGVPPARVQTERFDMV